MHKLPLADGGFPDGNSSSCERFPSPVGEPDRLAPMRVQKDIQVRHDNTRRKM